MGRYQSRRLGVKLMPNVTNDDRADWAECSADAFGIITYGGRSFEQLMAQCRDPGLSDGETLISDLIGDLMHLAARSGFDAHKVMRTGVEAFEYEAAPDYQGD